MNAAWIVVPTRPNAGVRAFELDKPWSTRLGAVVAMRVVGTRGNLVEVASPSERTCTSRMSSSLPVARMFVARTDLAPVLADGDVWEFAPEAAVTSGD